MAVFGIFVSYPQEYHKIVENNLEEEHTTQLLLVEIGGG
jgi:hypothetical protein